MTTNDARSLIVVTALRYSEEYGAAAIASVRDAGEEAVLLFVLDPDVPESVAGQLAEGGFLGERLMHELRDTMTEEYRERGQGHLRDLADRAREAGVAFETRMEEGPFVEMTCRTALEEGVGRILAAEIARSPLSRVFLRSETRQLTDAASCPVVVFDLTGAIVSPRSAARRP